MFDVRSQDASTSLKGDAMKLEAEDEDEDVDEEEVENPPWWATVRGCALCWGSRCLGALVVVILVLALAACLMFGDSPDSSGDVAPAAAGSGDNAIAADGIQQGYIINAPTRCPDGQRYFRGKCRKVF